MTYLVYQLLKYVNPYFNFCIPALSYSILSSNSIIVFESPGIKLLFEISKKKPKLQGFIIWIEKFSQHHFGKYLQFYTNFNWQNKYNSSNFDIQIYNLCNIVLWKERVHLP